MTAFPRRVAERVTALGNTAFPTYLVQGDRESLLVEAGVSASAAQALAQLGRPLENIRRLVVTHAHFDHVVGAATWRRAMPWLEVVASAGSAPALGLQPLLDVFVVNDAKASALLVEHGLAPAAPPAVRPTPDLFHAVLAPGALLDLGGVELVVLDASGHAPGGVILFEPSSRVVFSSDSVGCHLGGGRFAANFFGGLDAYLENLEAIAALRPRRICPAHGDSVGPEGVEAYLRACREEIDWVCRAARAHPAVSDLPEELVEAIFARHNQGLYACFPADVTRQCAEQLIWRVLDAEVPAGPE